MNSFQNPSYFKNDNYNKDSEYSSKHLNPQKNQYPSIPPVKLAPILENSYYTSDNSPNIKDPSYINFPSNPIDRYKYQEASTHILDNYKLLDLQDLTPNDNDISSDDEKKSFPDLPSPILNHNDNYTNSYNVKKHINKKNNSQNSNNNEIYQNSYNERIFNQKPKAQNSNNNKTLNEKKHPVNHAILEIDQLLKISSELNLDNSTEDLKIPEPKWEIHDLQGKYTQIPTKSKRKMDSNRREIELSRKKYEEKTYEIYHKKENNDSNKVILTDTSIIIKPQDFQEVGFEDNRKIPFMEPFENMKSLKNLNNNNNNNLNKNKNNGKQLKDISKFDQVFCLDNKSPPLKDHRIFPTKDCNTYTTDPIEIQCLDCQKFVTILEVDHHIFHCPVEEKAIKFLPDFNEVEIKKIETIFEDNMVVLSKIKDRKKEKNPFFLDIFIQFKTILINSDSKIIGTALKRIENQMKSLDLEAFDKKDLDLCLRNLITLSREKLIFLKFCLETKNTKVYQNQLLTELKRLETETKIAEKNLISEIKEYNEHFYDKSNDTFNKSGDNYSKSNHNFKNSLSGNSSSEYYNSTSNASFEKKEKESFDYHEQNKREFYSEAVSIKLGLPNSHKGREVVISELYEECQRRKIDKKGWANFIREKFGC